MDFNGYRIRPTKHFALGWMRKWDWDVISLHAALERAYKIENVGRHKYEAYIKLKGKSRKIIFVRYEDSKEIIIITGAEGT